MTHAKTHILIAEGAVADNAGYVLQANGPIAAIQPPNPVEFGAYADEVTFIISVAGVTGAPTSWSLGAKFQYCLPHTTGYQYQNPRWFDLQPENVETNVVEGVGWYGGNAQPPADGSYGTLATSAEGIDFAANPRTVKRTVRHFGHYVRVSLNPTFTGGTNPGLLVSMVAIPKGSNP